PNAVRTKRRPGTTFPQKHARKGAARLTEWPDYGSGCGRRAAVLGRRGARRLSRPVGRLLSGVPGDAEDAPNALELGQDATELADVGDLERRPDRAGAVRVRDGRD